jgi:hypothetical protein
MLTLICGMFLYVSGANSTTVTYNATRRLMRYEKNFFTLKKRSSLPQRWSCCCKFGNRGIDAGILSYDREFPTFCLGTTVPLTSH